jgi:polyhydroxyalkanoate synthesis regulator phasin
LLKEEIHKKLKNIEASLTQTVNSRNATTEEIHELKQQITDTEAKIK